MTKAEIRKKCLEIRKSLPFREADADKIMLMPEYKRAETVFCYISAKNEIGTHLLIQKMLRDKKTVCVPFCVDNAGTMISVKIDSFSCLREGFFGILEPENPVEYDKTKIDLVLMPGVAFSKDGVRVGYGKGYYDKFLSDISPYKIGFCHRELLTDIEPEAYDVPADKVMGF